MKCLDFQNKVKARRRMQLVSDRRHYHLPWCIPPLVSTAIFGVRDWLVGLPPGCLTSPKLERYFYPMNEKRGLCQSYLNIRVHMSVLETERKRRKNWILEVTRRKFGGRIPHPIQHLLVHIGIDLER